MRRKKERKKLQLKVESLESTESDLKAKLCELENTETSMKALKLEVQQLEEARSREQDRADHANQLLTAARSQLIQVETDAMKKCEEMDEVKRKLEVTTASLEHSKQELAQLLSRNENSASEGRTRVNQLERQIIALESSTHNKTSELKEKQNEVDNLRKEFETYKVRAQSVLKQAKEAQINEEDNSKVKEELRSTQKMVEAIKDKLRLSLDENKTVKVESNRLQQEHDRLMQRHSILLQEIAGKEKTWRAKLETLESKLKEEEKNAESGADKLELQLDLLRQKHNQEIQLLKTQHAADTTKFKTQIDVAENEIVRLEFVLQKEQEAQAKSHQEARRVAEELQPSAQHHHLERLDISQIEREAAEGQEVDVHTTSSTASMLASPLPLEQLLAGPSSSGFLDSDVIRSAASSRQGGGGDRTLAGSRQSGADRQMAHLSALLSESEAQNERLEKLTEVLKEEIRTYQRSEERHKHIENLEYTKNIILKFLTLSGEERVRLVPVLSTILRLSREEINTIEQVAKQEQETAAQAESWGTYLHLWSTP